MNRMFGPLKFPEVTKMVSFDFISDESVTCLLCDNSFTLPTEKSEFLTHLFLIHKLVIADVDNIACLKGYVRYWRTQFSSKPLNYFCTTMLCDTTSKEGTSKEQYFLLSDVVPEDKLIREGLQKKRVEWILLQQERERETPISQTCLFCKLHFEGPRKEYFKHLYLKHNLRLGSPDNLVFTDELLLMIKYKLESLQCMYCDGVFKDRTILKEHMRKKQHKRINPENAAYDQFFIVNYTEVGKNWQEEQDEADDQDLEDRDDWFGWQDSENPEPLVVCLYCEEARCQFDDVLSHMQSDHNFMFRESCKLLGLNFYQQMKLVNYIRLQVYKLQCTNCDATYSTRESLLEHMAENLHFKIPSASLWEQPEFYFPTYENDSFLCQLDDSNDDTDELSNLIKECGIEDQPEKEQCLQNRMVQ